MQFKNHMLNLTVYGLGLATICLLGTQPLLAQIGSEAASEAASKEFDTDKSNDIDKVFSGRDNTGTSVLNLMNKLQDLNYYTPTREEQLEGINGAVQEFHRKQQQRLQEQSVVSPK